MQRRLRSKYLSLEMETCLLELGVELELSLGELTQVWMLGVGSDRSLGRPKEWNGEPSAKRWEDDLNEFVKEEQTEATQSNDLKMYE